MPSFDVVSELDHHEVDNALDQVRREIGNRFDFKGIDARVDKNDSEVMLVAEADFQLQQMLDMLRQRLSKRGIDLQCLDVGEVEVSGKTARLPVTLREGLDADLARKIVKQIKEAKLKVQAAIQGDQVRVTGKKRDDLQSAIALLKGADLGLPLQYTNFRD